MLKNITIFILGFVAGTIVTQTRAAEVKPEAYDPVKYTGVFVAPKTETIASVKEEKQAVDLAASKYAQLYDGCKNK